VNYTWSVPAEFNHFLSEPGNNHKNYLFLTRGSTLLVLLVQSAGTFYWTI